jgi:hypothetical protein
VILDLWREALPHIAFFVVHVSHSRISLLREMCLSPSRITRNGRRPDGYSRPILVSTENASIFDCMLLEGFLLVQLQHWPQCGRWGLILDRGSSMYRKLAPRGLRARDLRVIGSLLRAKCYTNTFLLAVATAGESAY